MECDYCQVNSINHLLKNITYLFFYFSFIHYHTLPNSFENPSFISHLHPFIKYLISALIENHSKSNKINKLHIHYKKYNSSENPINRNSWTKAKSTSPPNPKKNKSTKTSANSVGMSNCLPPNSAKSPTQVLFSSHRRIYRTSHRTQQQCQVKHRNQPHPRSPHLPRVSRTYFVTRCQLRQDHRTYTDHPHPTQ